MSNTPYIHLCQLVLHSMHANTFFRKSFSVKVRTKAFLLCHFYRKYKHLNNAPIFCIDPFFRILNKFLLLFFWNWMRVKGCCHLTQKHFWFLRIPCILIVTIMTIWCATGVRTYNFVCVGFLFSTASGAMSIVCYKRTEPRSYRFLGFKAVEFSDLNCGVTPIGTIGAILRVLTEVSHQQIEIARTF